MEDRDGYHRKIKQQTAKCVAPHVSHAFSTSLLVRTFTPFSLQFFRRYSAILQ
jgi:hypothetical protein